MGAFLVHMVSDVKGLLERLARAPERSYVLEGLFGVLMHMYTGMFDKGLGW